MAPHICESPGCGRKLRWWERITGCRRVNEHRRLAVAYHAVLAKAHKAAQGEEAAERVNVPTPVINDDAQKLEKGESASTKASVETIARQQAVEAAEQAKVPAQADSNAVQEQEGSHPASIKDAQASTTHQVQNDDPVESLCEVSARLEAARMAEVEPPWGAEHPLSPCMPNAATRDSSNEEGDVPRVRFPSSIEIEHADRADADPEADPYGHWPTAIDGLSPKKKSRRRQQHCNHPQWDKVLGAGSCESCQWLGRRRHFMPYFLYKCRGCQVRHCKWCAQHHGRLYG